MMGIWMRLRNLESLIKFAWMSIVCTRNRSVVDVGVGSQYLRIIFIHIFGAFNISISLFALDRKAGNLRPYDNSNYQ